MGNLEQKFRAAVGNAFDQRGKPALLGKSDGTLYWVDDSGMTHRTRVWARIGEQASNQAVVVDCLRASPQLDMPVRVDYKNGRLTVVDVDERRAIEFSGGRGGATVPPHWWLHSRLGPDPGYIEGLQFLPLLVTPTNPPDLTVTVQGGAYTDSAGDLAIHETAASGSTSAFVPATDYHFVIICLDRTDGSIVIVDGGDITAEDVLFSDVVVTPADIEAITISADYKTLGVVLLYPGQTQIKAKDIVADLRTDSAAGSVLPAGTDGQIQYNNGGAFGGFGFWDDATGRLGIGTVTPQNTVHIKGNGEVLYLEGNAAGDANVVGFGFYDSGGTRRGFFGDGSASNDDIYLIADTGNIYLYANGTIRATLFNGLQIGSPSGGDPGAGAIGIDSHINLDETSSTPASPTAGTMSNVYMKADKLVIQYNDAGTVRYKFLDLTGVGVTWQHSTTAP